MLKQPKQKEFQDLVKDATHAELVWMSGFLQELLSQNRHANHSSAVGKPLAGKRQMRPSLFL